MNPGTLVTRVGDDVFRVETDGSAAIVYVAGIRGDRWAFHNGEVYRVTTIDASVAGAPARSRARTTRQGPSRVAAPMPATVLKVNVKPGDAVANGDVLIVLEAMKMELPLRATENGTVSSVSCREGELVAADAELVTLEPRTA